MAIRPGTRVGPYEITAKIGAGGMGEVYRATDTNLKRAVAIKVLPDALAADSERLARFQREAEVLASLNHPNIAQIYGLERLEGREGQEGSATAFVMELVEGPTLAELIASRQASASRGLEIDDALSIATQIAEALEAAHEQGIIHRDLKPANVKVRPDGTVKVLDFGLAKLVGPSEAAAGAGGGDAAQGLSLALTNSPTLTTPVMTQAGVILGTAAYMSPEQAKGRPADKRSDVWAFGCVLYELLTGKRAFDGDDVSDTLAAVLRGEPDQERIPVEVPAPIRSLIDGCLKKDRNRRIGDLSTAIFLLRQPGDRAPASITQLPPHPRWKRAIPLAAAGIIGSLLTAAVLQTSRRAPPVPLTVARFPIPLQENLNFPASGLRLVAISPDGTKVVYQANEPRPEGPVGGLYLRSISDATVRLIPGTEQSIGEPIFSPDGQSLVFFIGNRGVRITYFAKGVLKRIAIGSGATTTLCEIELPFGVSWTGEEIVFGQSSKGIMRVSANGGEPEVLVAAKEDELLQGPQVLPDRRGLLFTVAAGVKGPSGPTGDVWDKASIVVQSLESGQRKLLVKSGSDARYVPTGHLVYAVAGTLRAVPFDANRLEIVGEPVPVVEGVARSRYGPLTVTGSAHFGVSDTGSLVYLPGPVAPSSSPLQDLALLDRNGNVELLKLSPTMYEFPRISSDGKQVAVGVDDGKAANVWIYDLSGTSSIRQLTFGGRNQFPVWLHDGQHVAFQSDREGDLAIFRQRADGSQQAERLTKPEQGTSHVPDSWSPDGRHLLYEVNSESKFSLWVFSVQDQKGTAFGAVESSSVPPAAAFSPDGRWVAYQSDEIPNPTIFVQPFPGPGVPQRIVRGRHPQWSPDGKQLFYTSEDRIFAVNVSTRPGLTFTAPTFVTRGFTNARMPRNYDVTSDSSRFLGVTDAAGQSSLRTTAVRRIEVVLNWFEDLKRFAPKK